MKSDLRRILFAKIASVTDVFGWFTQLSWLLLSKMFKILLSYDFSWILVNYQIRSRDPKCVFSKNMTLLTRYPWLGSTYNGSIYNHYWIIIILLNITNGFFFAGPAFPLIRRLWDRSACLACACKGSACPASQSGLEGLVLRRSLCCKYHKKRAHALVQCMAWINSAVVLSAQEFEKIKSFAQMGLRLPLSECVLLTQQRYLSSPKSSLFLSGLLGHWL